jgi:ABC-type phosphate transport system substrate-binding protein
MFVRKSLAGALTATLAGAALAFAAAPANADYVADIDDSVAHPVSADLIGVGSDTTQHAMKLIADAWNNDSSHTFRIATFAATEGNTQPQHAGATIPLPSGDAARPNGSGAGKTTLFNPSNADIDFARSSDSLSDAEFNAGLKAFPFALDTLGVAVSGSVASHAPATLTVNDLVKIYECQPGATNWSDFGGTAGTIAPKSPQSGSGTAKFFKKQLDAAKGSTVSYGACVDQTVQEHSADPIKNDVNAVAPFSVGRAGLLGGTVKMLGGFTADRALYNVVRGADIAKPEFQSVFGEDGFICSAAAFQLVADAGFKQLATPAHGGVCGTAVQATTDFDLNAPVNTTTTLAGTATKSGVKLVATVTGGATGDVQFFEGDNAVGSAHIVSGQATITVGGATVGSHSYRASYVPDDSIYVPSEDGATVLVKGTS